MANKNTRLIDALDGYLSKVETQTSSSGAPLVFEVGAIVAPSTSLVYDIKERMANHVRYDLRSAKIVVLVKDTVVGSLTNGFYINSETVIAVGVDNTGLVRIYNASTASVDLCIRVNAPSILK